MNRPAAVDTDEHIWPKVDNDGLITFPPFSLGNTAVNIQRTGDNNEDSAIEEVENGIRARISSLSFTIDPVSVFVLTNIIFPEAKVMKTTKVYIPGDMLVLGQVVRDYVPMGK